MSGILFALIASNKHTFVIILHYRRTLNWYLSGFIIHVTWTNKHVHLFIHYFCHRMHSGNLNMNIIILINNNPKTLIASSLFTRPLLVDNDECSGIQCNLCNLIPSYWPFNILFKMIAIEKICDRFHSMKSLWLKAYWFSFVNSVTKNILSIHK